MHSYLLGNKDLLREIQGNEKHLLWLDYICSIVCQISKSFTWKCCLVLFLG
jgi:hypothetical protein